MIRTSMICPSVASTTLANPERAVWSSVAVRRKVPSGTSGRLNRPSASVGATANPARLTLAEGMGVTPSVPTNCPRTVPVPPSVMGAEPPLPESTISLARPATLVPPIVRLAQAA